jgi:hypothetical protein
VRLGGRESGCRSDGFYEAAVGEVGGGGGGEQIGGPCDIEKRSVRKAFIGAMRQNAGFQPSKMWQERGKETDATRSIC